MYDPENILGYLCGCFFDSVKINGTSKVIENSNLNKASNRAQDSESTCSRL